MSRRFTFIYIPESGKQARRLVVSRSVVGALLGVLLLAGGVLGYVVVDCFNLQFDQRQFERLLVENSQQRQQLSKLNRDLSDLRGEVMVLAESDARVRDALEVSTEKASTVPVGIGGALDNNPSV